MTRGGRAIPENPVFATESERLVWEALRATLADDEVLLHGLRFSDRQAGDIEIDLLLLSPRLGAAVIEVKGGMVQYVDGTWTTTNASGAKRRIHPTDQARRAKHALRKYLDRQPEWGRGLIRSQWFLAMPYTPVSGDMGPEAHREQVLGQGDLPAARAMIDSALIALEREPAVPDGDWVEVAVRLVLEAPDSSLSHDRFSEAVRVGPHGMPGGLVAALVALASAGVAAALSLAFGGWGAAAATIFVGTTLLAMTSSGAHGWLPRRTTLTITGLVMAGVTGTTVWVVSQPQRPPSPTPNIAQASVVEEEVPCSSAYAPCVRESVADRDCPDIGFRVTLVSTDDPYGLDRDGNGVGCESFPADSLGEEAR